MALAGRPPKENALNKNPKTHDWTEIPFVYNGSRGRPNLPPQREIFVEGGLTSVDWSEMTQQWFKELRRMPHTTLWRATDWNFALESAVVYDDAARGKTAAAGESRQRQAIMGTTYESRLKLRIKYIDPVDNSEIKGDMSTPKSTKVLDMAAARRARMMSED